MIFQSELLFEFVQELTPLLQLHHAECGSLGLDLDPDWELYAALEQAGKFKAITARKDGLLVGYGGFLIQPSLHNKGLLILSNDVFFLHPKCRYGRNGLYFIWHCEREFSKQYPGAALTWGAQVGSAMQTILQRDGYAPEFRMAKIMKEV